MSPEAIKFVNTGLVPIGLMAIMFSLGLSLIVDDFRRLLQRPKAALTGVSGQIILLPLVAWGLAILFKLPAAMAVGLIILAACPGGVTSNAVVFAARGDVALSVTLTALSSMITIITTPLLIGLGLKYFYDTGQAPELDVLKTVTKLAQVTVIPVALGMMFRAYKKDMAEKMIIYLRPTSMIILIAVIGFSVFISLELLKENIVKAGPVVFLLNLIGLAIGYWLARLAKLTNSEVMTVAIEVGLQNVALATFLSLTILKSWDIAITPTLYGVIMIFNAGLFVKFMKSKKAVRL